MIIRCSPSVSSITSVHIENSLIGEAATNLLHWLLRYGKHFLFITINIIIVIIMIRCAPALKLLDLSSCDLDSIPSLRSNTLTTLNISSNRLSELHTGDADDDVDYDEDSQS